MTFRIVYVPATMGDVERLDTETRAGLDALLARLAQNPYEETQPDPRSPSLRRARTPNGLRVLLSVSGRPPFLKPEAFWEPTVVVVEVKRATAMDVMARHLAGPPAAGGTAQCPDAAEQRRDTQS